MADLLECLLQIKALRETIARVEALGAASALPAAGHDRGRRLLNLVGAEARAQAFLRATLPPSRTGDLACPEPASPAPDDIARCFVRARLSTLDVLDRCSAGDLGATGAFGGRARVSVADVVATMLAADTEHLGEMRRAAGAPSSPQGDPLPEGRE